MERRQKDIYTMAEQAGLSPQRYERKSNRGCLLCVAENGAERTFAVSLGNRIDPRGDMNELGAMKRFARENKLPERPAAPPTTAIKKATLTMPKAPAATSQATTNEQLPPVAFYRVCEWLKSQKLSNFPSLEALALQAAQHIQTAVSESNVKLALEVTGTKEPEHWSDPTDPNAIIVRELSRIMKQLGEKPTPAFERLATVLLP
ncbi:hypothetical protein KW843_22950 [Acidovorax sp. sif1233]|uniref:hypothetical protein n=1 Tax=Acidovorax sp. sif1233 TaxID=2854792 RepID=UPI001C46434B|nr:hypothetical protein [Acidovorax sp. sif1233]MBV7457357.1 hypothetical protein [Acidovorax sp. sif1233]